MSSGTAAYAASATVYGRNAGDSYYQLNGTGPVPPSPDPNVEVAGNLTVSGDSILIGLVEMDAGLAVTGLISSTTLSVSGAAGVGSLNVAGAANVATLNVSGVTTLVGKLNLGTYNGDPGGVALLNSPSFANGGSGTLASSLLWDFGVGGAAYNNKLTAAGLYFFRISVNPATETYCSFFVEYFDENNENVPRVRPNFGQDIVPLQDYSGSVFSYTGLRITTDPANPTKMYVSLTSSTPTAVGATSYYIATVSAARVA